MTMTNYWDTTAHGLVPVGARVVYTAGTFDILHPGHIRLFEQCRRIAGKDGIVCVGVNSDAFIEKYRGQPPVMSERERSILVAALKDVNSVLTNQDPQQEVMELAFAIGEKSRIADPIGSPRFQKFLVVGSDWAAKDYYAQIGVTQQWLDTQGIVLCYVPYTQGISSMDIKWRTHRK
jgi:cytidyltransferase-like protein